MAKLKEKDYEVQEKEVTRYECDWCGAVVDEGEVNFQKMWEGPDSQGESLDSGHLCDECSQQGRRLDLVDMMERRRRVSLALKAGQTLVAGAFFSPVGAGAMYGAFVLGSVVGRPWGVAAGLAAGAFYATLVAAVLGKYFVTVEGSG
jgi:hypothetical protein